MTVFATVDSGWRPAVIDSRTGTRVWGVDGSARPACYAGEVIVCAEPVVGTPQVVVRSLGDGAVQASRAVEGAKVVALGRNAVYAWSSDERAGGTTRLTIVQLDPVVLEEKWRKPLNGQGTGNAIRLEEVGDRLVVENFRLEDGTEAVLDAATGAPAADRRPGFAVAPTGLAVSRPIMSDADTISAASFPTGDRDVDGEFVELASRDASPPGQLVQVVRHRRVASTAMVSPDDGRQLWRKPHVRAVSFCDDTVIAVAQVTAPDIVALDPRTGAEKWRAEAPGDNWAPLPGCDGRWVVFAGDRRVVAFEVATGLAVWQVDAPVSSDAAIAPHPRAPSSTTPTA